MENLLPILVAEDIVFLVVVCLFLYLRQRAYTILAIIFVIELLIANFISFKGYQSLFLIILPYLSFVLFVVLGRPFLPRPRITMGVQTTKIVMFIALPIALFLIILSVIAIIFFRR